jgi:hypothetical protein
MARNHLIVPTAPHPIPTTVRLGATADASGNMLEDYEVGKLVKLVGSDRYNLCAAGDPIEGVITSVEQATQNGWSVGGVAATGKIYATADGLQATAGTGTIAFGDYVLAGTVTAKGTRLTRFPKVVKATTQTAGTTDFRWRVVSLGTAATGAVGTDIVIERV